MKTTIGILLIALVLFGCNKEREKYKVVQDFEYVKELKENFYYEFWGGRHDTVFAHPEQYVVETFLIDCSRQPNYPDGYPFYQNDDKIWQSKIIVVHLDSLCTIRDNELEKANTIKDRLEAFEDCK